MELGFAHWLGSQEPLPSSAIRLVGLDIVAKGLVLAAQHQRSTRPLLAVFGHASEARQAIESFEFFASHAARERIHYLPPVDFDFYRGLLPNPETLCDRNVGLFQALNSPERRVFVTTATAFLQKVFPPSEFLAATITISPTDEVDREGLIRNLLAAGYQRQPSAYDPGVFSVRGGVIDVFCPLYDKPLRIEFFGDLIEEIRHFDAKSQRSLDKVTEAYLIPVGQSLIPHGDQFPEAAARIKERLDDLDIPKAKRDELILKIQDGVVTSDSLFLFPLLSRGSSSLLDYFPPDVEIIWDGKGQLEEMALETELPRLLKSHSLFEKEPTPIAKAEELFLTAEEFKASLEKPGAHFFEAFQGKDADWKWASDTIHLQREGTHKPSSHPVIEGIARQLKEWVDLGYRVQIVCHTQTHGDRISGLFQPYGIRFDWMEEGAPTFPALLHADFAKVRLCRGFLAESRIYPELKWVLLSEEQIFGSKKRAAKSSSWTSASDPARLLSSFRDLQIDDFVVHREFGIGKYLGLKTMNFQGVENDYVLLEYKDNDKLYIPVYRLNILQKYVSGESGTAQLDKLGGDRWSKAKGKAQKAVQELAAEFLKIHALRKLIPAHAFSPPGADYSQFEMEFPFDETPDQQKAIDDVMLDLSEPHPMDRLVCGDVGYGKTEVAMRAAYRAVLDGKQVAVLVPTTVLAFQHNENFKKRFKNTPIRIEMISRMRSSVEIKKVLAETKEGKVDILIGTHRLLSADIGFKNLGIAIIDEEHRFGVVHKERLKRLTESVHLLSLTATPIPRTLNMAMTGIKEISIITTPPPDRLSVRTFVCRQSPEVIAEAITNELARDGQVFFVHNRIESIFKLGQEIQQILPKIKIEIVHGQMDGETLEKKMLTFYQGEAQVLLTTAIIESGLDIPRANTILIDRADTFGLAQLYQLRGRVGRSEKRAFCYLLVPGENQMTEDAKQRLQVVQRYTELGSGFHVASHDLEIRGAGDLLGKDQSGHLAAVGVDMYFELLEESMRDLRGQTKKVEIEPEISMKIAASFPPDYLPDVSERVLLYRRLSSVEHEESIADIETEIRDRFGELPEEVFNLLGLMKIKLHLKRLHVVRMSVGPKKTSLQFAPSTPASPEKLVRMIQKDDPDDRYSLTPDQKLVVEFRGDGWRGQLQEIIDLCDALDVP